MGTPVTDPAILAQLNGASSNEVTDPSVLAQLNGVTATPAPQAAKPAGPTPPWADPGFPDIPRAIGEGVTSMASSMLAKPVSDIAGLAAMGKEMVSPTPGGGDPEGFKRYVQDAMTFQPRTGAGQALMKVPQAIGQVAHGVTAPLMASMRGDSSADSRRGMAANAVGEATSQGMNFLGLKGAQAVPKINAPGWLNDLRGVEVPAARAAAQDAARSTLESHASDLAKSGASDVAATRAAGASDIAESHTLGDVRTRLERDLAAQSDRPIDLATQGKTARDAYMGVMNSAEERRSATVAPMYKSAEDAAAAKESTGARIDVSRAAQPIQELLKLSDNIPTLKTKLESLLSSVEGRAPPPAPPAAPVGSGIVTSRMMQPRPAAAPPVPLTYKELSLASKFMRDIGYGADLEGYGGIVRRTAREAAHNLDESLKAFVPEHGAASAKYAELSKPMESLGTKYGKAVANTEGGFRDDYINAVDPAAIPGRLFSKPSGVQVMVDALAGGSDVKGAPRVKAQRMVDDMVEKWILEGKVQGATGQKAADILKAPAMRADLTAVPNVADRLAQRFERQAATEKQIGELGDAAKTKMREGQSKLNDVASPKITLAERIKSELVTADAAAAMPGKESQSLAYESYIKALRAQANSGALTSDKYKAALALIDRAETVEAKVKRARRIAAWGAGAVGIGAVDQGIRRLAPTP